MKKNYQIWYHRRALLEEVLKKGCNHDDSSKTIEACEKELEYIAAVLEEDAKNYHVSTINKLLDNLKDQQSLNGKSNLYHP